MGGAGAKGAAPMEGGGQPQQLAFEWDMRRGGC